AWPFADRRERSRADLDQKRIGAPFLAKRAARPMTANEADVIAERQELFADGSEQRLVIASRQVGPSDRSSKQHIADLRETCLAIIVDHVTGRMPRAMEDLEGVTAKR